MIRIMIHMYTIVMFSPYNVSANWYMVDGSKKKTKIDISDHVVYVTNMMVYIENVYCKM